LLERIDSSFSFFDDTDIKTLVQVLLECGFVELEQEMWRECLSEELLKNDDDLPPYVNNWMDVRTNTF